MYYIFSLQVNLPWHDKICPNFHCLARPHLLLGRKFTVSIIVNGCAPSYKQFRDIQEKIIPCGGRELLNISTDL